MTCLSHGIARGAPELQGSGASTVRNKGEPLWVVGERSVIMVDKHPSGNPDLIDQHKKIQHEGDMKVMRSLGRNRIIQDRSRTADPFVGP
jgi:hypothetical protein